MKVNVIMLLGWVYNQPTTLLIWCFQLGLRIASHNHLHNEQKHNVSKVKLLNFNKLNVELQGDLNFLPMLIMS